MMIEAFYALIAWTGYQSLLYDVKKDEPKKPPVEVENIKPPSCAAYFDQYNVGHNVQPDPKLTISPRTVYY